MLTAANTADSGGIVRLSRAVREYETARRGQIARETRRSISEGLTGFVLYMGDETAVKAVKPKHVQQYLSDHPQWAPSTARLRLGIISTFFAWCQDNGYCPNNPASRVRAPTQPRGIPRELTTEDVQAVFAACPDARSSLICSLIFHEGLRRGGVANLKVEDIDGDVLMVTEKGGHTRVLPLSPHTRQALDGYLGEHPAASGPLVRSYMNGRGLTAQTIGAIVARIMLEAGVKTRAWDGKSTHAARHTFAGAMLDDGADIRTVSAALGHVSVQTTAIYLKRRTQVADIREHQPNYSESTGGGR